MQAPFSGPEILFPARLWIRICTFGGLTRPVTHWNRHCRMCPAHTRCAGGGSSTDMRAAGVTHAVLVQPSTAGYNNRYVVEMREPHTRPNSLRTD